MAWTTFAYVNLSISLSPLLTSIAATFDVSESAAGQLATVQGVVGTISALLSAPWMNRYSRRSWLRAELGVLVLGVVLSAAAPSFAVLLAARALIGIAAGALVANCFTAASEVVRDPRRQGRAVGIVASGTTVAVMLGLPAMAWLNDAVGWRWAMVCALVPIGISLAGTMFLPAAQGRARARDDHGDAIDAGSLRRILRGDAATVVMIVVSGLIFVAYVGWITYYSAYVERDFAGGARSIGLLFIVGGLFELAGNFVAPALSHWAPVRWVTLVGTAGVALALLGSGIAFRTVAGLYAGIALLHLATSFAYVGINTLLLQRPQAIRGTVMALSSAAVGFGGAMGALIGGAVLSSTGDYETIFHVLGALMALGVVALFFAVRTGDNQPQSEGGG
ncbi:MAG: MFS transporter [Thermomicrobiales bacterium]|nr:MFS transporter [Thermomicrobiales bacterium]